MARNRGFNVNSSTDTCKRRAPRRAARRRARRGTTWRPRCAPAAPARRPGSAFVVLGALVVRVVLGALNFSTAATAPRRRRRRPTRSRRTCGSCTQPRALPFVRAEGMKLWRFGEPYRFVGANLWQAMHLGADADARRPRARLVRELDRLQALGVANLRVMAASEGPDESDESVAPASSTSRFGRQRDAVARAAVDAAVARAVQRRRRRRPRLSARRARAARHDRRPRARQHVALHRRLRAVRRVGDGQGDPVPAARRGRQLGRLPAVYQGLLRQRRGARAARGARAVRGDADECDQRRRARRRPDDHGSSRTSRGRCAAPPSASGSARRRRSSKAAPNSRRARLGGDDAAAAVVRRHRPTRRARGGNLSYLAIHRWPGNWGWLEGASTPPPAAAPARRTARRTRRWRRR